MCYQKNFNTYQLIPEKMSFLSYMFDKAPNKHLKYRVVVKSLANTTSIWFSSYYSITSNISLTSCMGNLKILSVWWALNQTPHFWDSCRPQRVHQPVAQLCFHGGLKASLPLCQAPSKTKGSSSPCPGSYLRDAAPMCTMFIRPTLVLTVCCIDKKDSQGSG